MAGGYETTATVKSAKIEYDVEKQWGSWNPTFDMFLTVTYNDGQDWDNEIEIYGNVKRDIGTEDPKSWGSAFKIKAFFESVFNEKDLLMNDDYTIPDKWLDITIGRNFKVCRYKTTKMKKNGKHFWDTYKIVAPATAPDEKLKEKVLKDVKDGWIKNYYSEDIDRDFSTSSNSKKETVESKDTDSVDFELDI